MKSVTKRPGSGDSLRHRTPTDEVESALTAAAYELLAAEGPTALTVRRVAALAGVAPMGVYNRFGSKEGLVDALFRRGFEELADGIDAIEEGPIAEALLAGMLAYRQFALANRARYALMFDRPIPGCEPSPASHTAAWDAFGRLVTKIQRAIDTGAVGDGKAEDDEAVAVAQMFWGAAHGAVSLELREIGFVEDRAENFARMIRALIRGLGGPPPAGPKAS